MPKKQNTTCPPHQQLCRTGLTKTPCMATLRASIPKQLSRHLRLLCPGPVLLQTKSCMPDLAPVGLGGTCVSGRLIGQMHVWPEAQAGVGRHGWWRRAGRWQLQLTVGPAFSTYCRRTLGCAPGRRASSPRTVCRGRRLGDRVTGHLHWDVLARGGRARLVAVRVSVSLSLSRS